MSVHVKLMFACPVLHPGQQFVGAISKRGTSVIYNWGYFNLKSVASFCLRAACCSTWHFFKTPPSLEHTAS